MILIREITQGRVGERINMARAAHTLPFDLDFDQPVRLQAGQVVPNRNRSQAKLLGQRGDVCLPLCFDRFQNLETCIAHTLSFATALNPSTAAEKSQYL